MRFAWRGQIGHYELNPFPGCNQLVVSNHAFIRKDMRGQGMGKEQHTDRLMEATRLGYDYMICTVRSDNAAEKAILSRYKWSKLDEFSNRETGNMVEIWGRRI